MTTWLLLQALVVVLGAIALTLRAAGVRWSARVAVLRAGLVALPLALLAPSVLPSPPAWTPGARMVADVPSGVPTPRSAGTAPLPAPASPPIPWWLLPATSLLVLGNDVRRLRGLLRGARPVHRIHGVEVRLGSFCAAVRSPHRIVVLDRSLRGLDRRVALRHELQHHRAGDTAWAWGWSALRALCWVNPAAHLLVAHARELDELACDASLRVDPLEYAGALLRAARVPVPVPAAALGAPLLPRRIAMLLSPPRQRSLPVAPAAVFVAALMTATVWGARPSPADDATPSAVVQAHPLVAERADRMATSAWIQSGIERTDTIAFVRGELVSAGLPVDLAAVPLVESGYRDLGPEANKHVDTAGIWQFIPSTARRYGLVVGDGEDQRRDLARSTAAALRLLDDLHREFGDWGLALAAYNVGSRKVRAQMKHFGTDDVLALIEQDALPSYAADVMAGAALLRAEGLID